MSASETMWRTSNPDVITAWHDTTTATGEFMTRLDKQIDAWGFADHQLWYSDSAFGGTRHMLGLPLPKGVTYRDRKSWPEGWRVERDRGYLVPARSTKAGKKVALVWDQFAREYPSPRKVLTEHGMPSYVLASLRAYAPAATLTDGTLWVRWQVDPTQHSEKVDLDVWQRVPLSEFYALVESGNDPWSKSP